MSLSLLCPIFDKFFCLDFLNRISLFFFVTFQLCLIQNIKDGKLELKYS